MTEHFLTTDIDYNMLYDTEFNVDGIFKLNGSPVVSQADLPFFDVQKEPFNAVGDGIVDDTVAINAALTAMNAAGGGTVQLARNHKVSGTLTIARGALIGYGGNVVGTLVTSDALTGPVIRIINRSCSVHKIKIDATPARRAAVTTTGHGIWVAGDDVPAVSYPSLSRTSLQDIWITNQPTDGLHVIGSPEYSLFSLITAQDCVRHGFVMDGGTVAGYSNVYAPPFEIKLDRCRAFECGGQALILQSSGGLAAHNVDLDHFEALGCAWDVAQRYLASEFQVLAGARGLRMNLPDIEDQQYANATTSLGNPKTVRAVPSKGISCSGFGTYVLFPYFSSLAQSWSQVAGAHGLVILFPNIVAGNYPTLQSPAILVPANILDVEVRWLSAMTSGATIKVQNQSVNARIIEDGIPKIGDALSSSDYSDGLVPVSSTIAAGVLNTTNRRTIVAGQGAVADDLTQIRLASGINGQLGMDMFLFRGSEDITVKHGVVDIRTSTGADVIMTAAANTVLHFMYDGTNWVQV